MADVKISNLPASTTPLAGTEVLPIVQSGATKQVAVNNLTAGRAVSASSLSLTTTPLGIESGGTGLSSLTNKGIPYATSTSAFTTDATLTFDGLQLLASGANNYSIKVARTDAYASYVQLKASTYQASFNWSNPAGTPFIFVDDGAGATRASIDYYGKFCIGTTSASELFEVNAGNAVIGNAAGNYSCIVSRITSLPSSLAINASTYNGNLVFTYSGAVGMGFYDSTAAKITAEFDNSQNFRPGADNVYSLGTAARRWSVVYAGTALINTSDAKLKQQIEDLTSAEQTVAKTIKGLFKTFKFNSAVAEKGENARIHVGVIAQDVKAAFTAQGLDASKYALFCSDTWWEYGNEKVEADENGIATLFVGYELDGEKLNISKYDTAPKGAIEIFETVQAKQVTQLGIRYEELLAFVISAL